MAGEAASRSAQPGSQQAEAVDTPVAPGARGPASAPYLQGLAVARPPDTQDPLPGLGACVQPSLGAGLSPSDAQTLSLSPSLSRQSPRGGAVASGGHAPPAQVPGIPQRVSSKSPDGERAQLGRSAPQPLRSPSGRPALNLSVALGAARVPFPTSAGPPLGAQGLCPALDIRTRKEQRACPPGSHLQGHIWGLAQLAQAQSWPGLTGLRPQPQALSGPPGLPPEP